MFLCFCFLRSSVTEEEHSRGVTGTMVRTQWKRVSVLDTQHWSNDINYYIDQQNTFHHHPGNDWDFGFILL